MNFARVILCECDFDKENENKVMMNGRFIFICFLQEQANE